MNVLCLSFFNDFCHVSFTGITVAVTLNIWVKQQIIQPYFQGLFQGGQIFFPARTTRNLKKPQLISLFFNKTSSKENFHNFLPQENVGLVIPWMLGLLTFMSLEAVSTVYLNILRDHINGVNIVADKKVFHFNSYACFTAFWWALQSWSGELENIGNVSKKTTMSIVKQETNQKSLLNENSLYLFSIPFQLFFLARVFFNVSISAH